MLLVKKSYHRRSQPTPWTPSMSEQRAVDGKDTAVKLTLVSFEEKGPSRLDVKALSCSPTHPRSIASNSTIAPIIQSALRRRARGDRR